MIKILDETVLITKCVYAVVTILAVDTQTFLVLATPKIKIINRTF
jgi:hypothetical protein